MSLVADGDTVLIDSGAYVGDVGVWNNNNLVIRCPNGMARFNANGNIAQKKGIWVLAGNNTYVEGFEFYGAAISAADGDNGAGIRVGGNGLTCRRCYFHDNQEGILTGNDTTNNNIWIEACEFERNGVETGGAAGYEHNIYVGHSASCTIKFCYFHASIVGHEIKTRANVNYILYNKIVDGPTGDGSYSIDMPNGGLSFVIGNSIEKGPMTANSTVISYGEEGIVNPDSEFYFINNTVVTDRNPTTFLNIQAGTKPALIANNIFAGPGHPLTAPDTMSNVVNTDTSFFHFANPKNYDYRITQSFPGFSSAAVLGNVDGFSLLPTSEYVDPEDSASRQFLFQVGVLALTAGSAQSDSVSIIKNFDTVCIGESDTGIVTIQNTGSVTHTFLIGIVGLNMSEFVIVSQNFSPIPPGGFDTVHIVFKPNTNGIQYANLEIGSANDIFSIEGYGGSAIIAGHDTISATVGATTALFTLTICNTGTCSCIPGLPNVDPQFTYVSGGTTPIGPGACEPLVFTFHPTKSGVFTVPVIFPTLTGFASPINVSITGIATSDEVSQFDTKDGHLIEQNYPNPFSTETIIPLPAGASGTLALYNECGIQMDVSYEQTENGLVIERGNLPAGIYFYRISQFERGTIAEGSVVIGN